MQLILAVEPNRSQAQQLASLVKQHLKAELVAAASADAALKTLGDRIPDLVLAPALLPSRDEAALTERLRGLGPAGSHVHTLAVPILSSVSARRGNSSLLGRRRDKAEPAETVGCDPEVFADQIKIYLERAATERATQAQSAIRAQAPPVSEAATPSPASDTDVGLSDILDTLWLPDPVAAAPSIPDQSEDPVVEPIAEPAQDQPAIAVIAADDGPALDVPPVAEDSVEANERDHGRAEQHPAVTKSRVVRPAAAAPSPHVRSVEAELGLLQSETSSPPLWRVTEGLDTFASPDDILPAEPGNEAVSIEADTSEPPAADATDPQPSAMMTMATDDVAIEVVEEAAADTPLIIDVAVPEAAVVPEAVQPAPAAPKPKVKMPRPAKKPAPPLDDWGYFDPSQSPFKALVRRLDEIAGQAAAAG